MTPRALAPIVLAALALAAGVAWLVGRGDARVVDEGEHAPSIASPMQVRDAAELADVEAPARAAREGRVDAFAPRGDASAASSLRIRVVDPEGRSPSEWAVEVRPIAFDAYRASDRNDSRWMFDDPAAAGVPAQLVLGGDEAWVELPPALWPPDGALAIRGRQLPDDESDIRQTRIVEPGDRGAIDLVVTRCATLVVRVEGPLPAGEMRFILRRRQLIVETGVRPTHVGEAKGNEAVFHLPDPGAYDLTVSGERLGEILEQGIEHLARGERRVVLVRFPDGAIEVDLRVLALSGRVECEPGDCPGLWATVDGRAPVAIPVADDGSFVLMHEPGERVELHAMGDDLEARTDPDVSTHAFGTEGVVLRRRPPAPRVKVALEIVDAGSGEPVLDAYVTFLRRDGALVRELDRGLVGGARFEMPMPVLEDVEYLVRAAGRRDATGRLFEGAGGGVNRTIRLERGFRRDFRVVDRVRRVPIAGAAIEHEGARVATTDAEGRARVELDAWPARLEVRADGFAGARWPPPWQSGVTAGEIALAPLD